RLEELAREVEGRGGGGSAPIPRVEGEGPWPLSFAQERLWFLERLDPGRPHYNLGSTVRLSGRLDARALERALDVLVRRHDALRTAFPMHGDAPAQEVLPPDLFRVEVEDLTSLPGGAREEEARRRAGEELRRPYDLARGPLFRARLFRLGDELHLLTLAMHHAVSDGWSMEVVFREVGTLYRALLRGEEPRLPALPVRYADYAAWQREVLRGGALEGEIAYWNERLRGAPAALDLPTDQPRPATQSFRGGIHSSPLPPRLALALRPVGRESGSTLFMTLLSAFDVLLARWSGQDDVVVGTAVAGRTRPEVQDVVGLFVNTLALRTEVHGHITFRELLRRVRDGAVQAFAHQELPFDRLVEELKVPRDPGRNPVYQVVLTLQDARGGGLRLDGVECAALPPARSHALFDLALTVREGGEGLEAVWDYAADLFDTATLERMADCYRTLLDAVAADPERPVADLPLLGEAERRRILAEWSTAPAGGAEERPVCERIAEQARRAPDAVALRFRDESLTYAELERRTDRLARHLRGRGVGRETVVGIYLDGAIDQVVSALAVHRAGGAFLPLDPGYPRDRLRYMLEDSGARVLLARAGQGCDLAAPGAGVVRLEDAEAGDATGGSTPPGDGPGPQDLAYIIYTSGSTGRPKGVQVEQRNLTHTLAAALSATGIVPGDEVHGLGSFSFDMWFLETFLPLAAGATVRLVPRERVLEVDRLTEDLRDATVVHAVPALMRQVVDRAHRSGSGPLTRLRRVFVGGDAVPPELLADMRAAFPRAGISVLYGPTEATVICASHAATGDEGARRMLGRPLAGVSLHVLDGAGHLVPAGVPGEVYVGGPGVARGYLNRPELTAERFLPDPFAAIPGARLYRTGDRARWRADGSLEFLGRVDHQVKVRGYRVELGEVESVLAEHLGVLEAVVLALEGVGGDRVLRACIVPAGEAPSTTELRTFLRERLPEAMIPAEYLTLAALPLSPTGKVDRQALAGLQAERADAGRPYAPPRTAVEAAVAGIWKEVLGAERVGIHDNFFELGGHSILLVRVAARIQETFRTEIPIRPFFEAPTVAALSAFLVEREARPGQTEKIAVVFNRISSMSAQEVTRALQGSTSAGSG
ncbi:MAG TPA: amino acid adenylation domain-containing protein, partial [Longimicrobiaceae bacterium]|nr:amino acid adenylation domain-containing protein [Longimicrobiaceae bacterium]